MHCIDMLCDSQLCLGQRWYLLGICHELLPFLINHKGVGMAHEITSPKKPASIFPDDDEAYWLGKTKPKQAFRLTRNTFNNLLQNF